jgi:hypothetical protein
MKKMGDGCEEVKMAQFWDCNPYVSVNQGHMMLKENYARSALDGIVKIACKHLTLVLKKWFMPILKHQLDV